MDAPTLTAQFGYDRLRYFQPLKSLFAAGGVVGGVDDIRQTEVLRTYLGGSLVYSRDE